MQNRITKLNVLEKTALYFLCFRDVAESHPEIPRRYGMTMSRKLKSGNSYNLLNIFCKCLELAYILQNISIAYIDGIF